METNTLEKKGSQHFVEVVKLDPQVIVLYEAWNYDNRS